MDHRSFLEAFGNGEQSLESHAKEPTGLTSPARPNTPLNILSPPLQTHTEQESDIGDERVTTLSNAGALQVSPRTKRKHKHVHFDFSTATKPPAGDVPACLRESTEPTVFYWNQPSAELNRFPSPFRETFLSRTPFCATQQEAHPGVFEEPEFDQIWEREPVFIDTSDVTILREEQFRGSAYRLRFLKDAFERKKVVLTRGTPIVFGGVRKTTTLYVVTWTRWANEETSLVQVNAFLCDQRTYNPYSPTWPSLLLEIPSKACFVPFPLAPPRKPHTPLDVEEKIRTLEDEVVSLRNMSFIQFIRTKLAL